MVGFPHLWLGQNVHLGVSWVGGEHGPDTVRIPQPCPRRGTWVTASSRHRPSPHTHQGWASTNLGGVSLPLTWVSWVGGEQSPDTVHAPQLFPKRGTWSSQPWAGDLGCGSRHHQGTGHVPARDGVPPTLMRFPCFCLGQKVDAGAKLPNYGGLKPHPSGVTTQEHHSKCHPVGAL